MILQQPTSARGFRQARCAGCGLTAELCICSAWPPLEAPIRVSVVMPPSEARSASNTARLLQLWLGGSTLHVRGAGLASPEPLLRESRAALLFPGGAPLERPPLTTFEHLIVPDGTWSQARRIERHWFAKSDLPRLELAPAWPSVYGLRRHAGGVCTFEAVAIALGLLTDPELADVLLRRFAEWARRAQLLKLGGPAPGTPPHDLGRSAPEHPATERLRARRSGNAHGKAERAL